LPSAIYRDPTTAESARNHFACLRIRYFREARRAARARFERHRIGSDMMGRMERLGFLFIALTHYMPEGPFFKETSPAGFRSEPNNFGSLPQRLPPPDRHRLMRRKLVGVCKCSGMIIRTPEMRRIDGLSPSLPVAHTGRIRGSGDGATLGRYKVQCTHLPSRAHLRPGSLCPSTVAMNCPTIRAQNLPSS